MNEILKFQYHGLLINARHNNRPLTPLYFFVFGALTLTSVSSGAQTKNPNLVYIFADQWRAQDLGYMGNKEVRTPNLDKLSRQSVNFTNAVSTCPVCSPYRASLLTGQYPLTHGVFHNDKPLRPEVTTIAEVYRDAGYQTGYIGKWHVDGHGRESFIPRERRQGFDFWKVLECTHEYNDSKYYGNKDSLMTWDGYDAFAQTKEAVRYIDEQKKGSPFILFLSWGPPHDPYRYAPEKYKKIYADLNKLTLRPNVPDTFQKKARTDLSNYYAQITALDDCMKEILKALHRNKIDENTILVFTSDHGDMLYSHALQKKQKPWDESIRVPFLIRYPEKLGKLNRTVELPISSPDIMPTLLGLSGIKIPETVEGNDFSAMLLNQTVAQDSAALIMCVIPHGQGNYRNGGREYRGIRTPRFTYVEDLKGPWLFFDNLKDPYQMKNLANNAESAETQQKLKLILKRKLDKTKDKFLTGQEYMDLWKYEWDKNDVPVK
jgi:arylsulfatase A-like enzyme